ncbi:hypothetical protein CEXT_755051 [Caerostris extrusa]|uniref:Uncharacterized protein n=1 Tax=Caerostris extrusa TaxID=172846 RepID=A0AAV4UDN6_CAEEX|nr:hypothetical protein CEXT_755051 [Caerostris extrusa]
MADELFGSRMAEIFYSDHISVTERIRSQAQFLAGLWEAADRLRLESRRQPRILKTVAANPNTTVGRRRGLHHVKINTLPELRHKIG